MAEIAYGDCAAAERRSGGAGGVHGGASPEQRQFGVMAHQKSHNFAQEQGCSVGISSGQFWGLEKRRRMASDEVAWRRAPVSTAGAHPGAETG